MEKVWLKQYPPGVPADINPDTYHSLVEIFAQSCERYADLPSFYNFGTTITYRELDKYSRDFAAYLQQVLKLRKGDRVAIMLPNLLQYPIVMLGALRAGLVVVNVNPLYTADELTHQMNDSGAVAIIALANFAATVQKALPKMPKLKHIIITHIGDMLPWLKANLMHMALKYFYKKIPDWQLPNVIHYKDTLKQGKQCTLQPAAIDGEDIAFLQYTGGTTGVSKGAMLTHRNIVANVLQINTWFEALVHEGNEIIITALPLYHIFSLTANCLFFSKIGGLNVLITNPRDLPGMIKDIRKFPFTAITGVNTLFNGLLKDSHFSSLDFSHLRFTFGGGMAVQRVVAERWQALTGKPLLEAYGLTETSPCVTINPYDLPAYNGSIGLPVSSTDVAILDDNGEQLGFGQSGELAVKGPQVMKGYWENAAETAKVFTKDGWLLTGDIATIDEQGFIRLLERKKDMILVSGFNVYPNEIEAVIARMPEVTEVGVVGIHDEVTGEAVKAFVVKSDENLTETQVRQFCRTHLTPYKVPKQVEFVKELPKSNVGKILRRFLKDGTPVQSG